MTLNVFIWDDYSQNIATQRENLIFNDEHGVNLTSTSDVYEALKYIDQAKKHTIYFFDVVESESGNSVGFDLAQRVRRKDNSLIIFVTDRLTQLTASPEAKLITDEIIYKNQKNWKMDILKLLEYAADMARKK